MAKIVTLAPNALTTFVAMLDQVRAKDGADEYPIKQAINDASNAIHVYCRRKGLLRQSLTQKVNSSGDSFVMLDEFPIWNVTGVGYYPGNNRADDEIVTIDLADIQWEASGVVRILKDRFPSGHQNIIVSAECGYDPEGWEISQLEVGCRITAQFMYQRYLNAYAEEFKEVGTARALLESGALNPIPSAALQYIEPFVRQWL